MLVLPLAENGSILAPILYFILLGGVTYTESFIFVNTGYKMGTEAALSILEGGSIQKFISCASVLGLFMMGGLSASMVLSLIHIYYASYHISFMVLGNYLVYRLYLGLRCIR